MNIASTKKDWPLGRGFERFYGFLGAETNQWYPDLIYDNHSVDQPQPAGGGLSLLGRHHRQGALVHPGRQGGRAGQAVLPLLLASAPPTLRTTCRRSGRTSTRASSTWATRPTASSCSRTRRSSGSSPSTPSCRRSTRTRDLTGPEGQSWGELDVVRPWDSLTRRREAPLRADGRGLRRLPQPRRRPARARARLPRAERPARQHADRARLRQRRVRRGRPERLGEREQVLQRPARHDRRGPQVRRRPRQPEDLQPLSDRLGLGLQHAVQDVEALRELPGRHGRPDDRLLAGADQGGGYPRPVHPRDRHRADDLRAARDRAAGGRQRLHAVPARGRELRGEPARRRRQGQADAVLLDARHPRRSTTTAGRPRR